MEKVKAEYIIVTDEDTGEQKQAQMIPPEPEGSDLGGITLEEKKKIAKNETLDIEVQQTGSQITSTYTFDEIMTAYSAGRDVRARFNSDNFSGKEIIMQKTGNSVDKIEFAGTMELSGKLIFLQLECSNQNEWELFSKQYIESNDYYLAIEDGAGAHNSTYRGKNLGTSVTTEQFERITDGTFRDLFVGDYWTINEVKYVIADFDYMYNVGDTPTTKHHIVVVPERSMYSHVMNDKNTTEGGYVASKMYTEGLDSALTSFKNAFGESHVLTYKNSLTIAASGGAPRNWSWQSRQIDLMSEAMVYGQTAWRRNGYDVGCQKSQLSLFKHRHDAIQVERSRYWLNDVCSDSYFACVTGYGFADDANAYGSYGVRPFVLIG